MDALSLHNLTPAELAAAATANFVAHATWVQEHTPGMHLIDTPGLMLVDSGLPCDTFNFACRAQLRRENARGRIDAVIDYFAGVNRPFSWWVNPGDQPADLGRLLLDAGLHRAESEMGMAADLDNLRLSELSPGGLQIRRVRTQAQLRDFATVVAANWTPPDAQVLRFYELAAPVLLKDDSALWLYVGYLGDIAVATADLATGGGVVGLYSICTLEAYRRRGFGSALTLQPLLDARAQSFRTAILQSAADSLYVRAGFETFGEITEYKP